MLRSRGGGAVARPSYPRRPHWISAVVGLEALALRVALVPLRPLVTLHLALVALQKLAHDVVDAWVAAQVRVLCRLPALRALRRAAAA